MILSLLHNMYIRLVGIELSLVTVNCYDALQDLFDIDQRSFILLYFRISQGY